MQDHVIIAGFGVGGRFIAEYLTQRGLPFCVIEMNPHTCETQAALGVEIYHGSVADESVLRAAGVMSAQVLALSIPDEADAIEATAVAHCLRPEIHIIASTRYTSSGFKALKNGADEVIVAEQAVAHEFYNRIDQYMTKTNV